MTTPKDVDVLIAGAGPVGLALAAELRRHGVWPRIVDKTGGTKTISKALILHVRTQRSSTPWGSSPRRRPGACR